MKEITSPPFNWERTWIHLNLSPFHYCMKIRADQFQRTHQYYSCKSINSPCEVRIYIYIKSLILQSFVSANKSSNRFITW